MPALSSPRPALYGGPSIDRSGLYLPRRGAQNEGSALFTSPRVLPALPRIGTPPPVRAPAFSRVPTSATRSPSRLPRPLEARYASFLESVRVVSSCTALPAAPGPQPRLRKGSNCAAGSDEREVVVKFGFGLTPQSLCRRVAVRGLTCVSASVTVGSARPSPSLYRAPDVSRSLSEVGRRAEQHGS